MVMYKIIGGGGHGGSKYRSLGQTLTFREASSGKVIRYIWILF